jgi:murein DD-endopeptidase MepM/ murein hydrolase activator NlpD
VLDQRGRLLRAALGFAGLPRPSYDRSLWALRTWLDSWSGIGRVAVGMAHQGYDPATHQLRHARRSRGWRLVLVAAALFDTVALAGCAAEGTTRILSYYGDWTGVRPGRRPGPHMGVDFDASTGDPVIAATDGTVVRVFVDGLCGNGIMVQHPVGENFWRTRYCHLDETNVQPGQQVKRGDVLGKVGTTGRSLGVPHLHFELHQPGGESFDRIDPLPFIVGCFDHAKTVTYSTLEASSAKPRPVLTYPVRCAGSIK